MSNTNYRHTWIHPRPGSGSRLNRQEIAQREALIDAMAPDATEAERVSIRQLFHRSGDTLGRCIVGVMARQRRMWLTDTGLTWKCPWRPDTNEVTR